MSKASLIRFYPCGCAGSCKCNSRYDPRDSVVTIAPVIISSQQKQRRKREQQEQSNNEKKKKHRSVGLGAYQ